jgi:hypothetical protein
VVLDHGRHVLPIEIGPGELLHPLQFLLVVVSHSRPEGGAALGNGGGQLGLKVVVVGDHLLAELLDGGIDRLGLRQLPQTDFEQIAGGGVKDEPGVLPKRFELRVKRSPGNGRQGEQASGGGENSS